MWIFYCTGVDTPNPCIVQESVLVQAPHFINEKSGMWEVTFPKSDGNLLIEVGCIQRGERNDWSAWKVRFGLIKMSIHPVCLLKSPQMLDGIWYYNFPIQWPFLNYFQWNQLLFELWHMYIPFWIFFHIYFDSEVFGNATNYYLLWGHEAVRWWGRALVSERED